MGACCCSLAGTDACKYCRNNGSTGIDYYPNYIYDIKYWTNYIYDNYPTEKQLDSITRKEDEWEIPSFMLKEDSKYDIKKKL